MTKIIAVTGATGAQGGGLVRAILADPEAGFAVRAITRNPDSPAALELERLGAEVVRADLDDVASLEAAFAGAYGAFCVTNFWEHFSPEREKQQAANLAAAAKAAGVQHVIWSTLEDTRERVPLEDARMPTLMGTYKVPHFDAKGESDAVFRSLGVPVTLLRTSFYWENFIYFGMEPKRGEDGVLELVLPMGGKRLSGISARDIGGAAYGIFRAGPSMIGRTVGIAGDHLTGAEMASVLTRVLGEEVRYRAVPADVYRGLGFPGAEDLGNMFQYYEEFEEEFVAARPVAATRALQPGLSSFAQWAEREGQRIPRPAAAAA